MAKGLLKVMSKMGISTLQSYKGAQIFEALVCIQTPSTRFSGTPSRIGGASFDAIQRDVVSTRPRLVGLKATDGPRGRLDGSQPRGRASIAQPGQFHYRNGGEVSFKHAHGHGVLASCYKEQFSRDTFLSYCREVDEVNAKSYVARGPAVAARRVG